MVWQFHSSCHGTNIRVGASGTKASRSPDTYDNGIVFSQTPIQTDETISLFFKKTASRWTGVPRIGFTNQNPDQRDPKSLPQIYTEELSYKDKTWAMPLAKQGDENIFVDYEFDHNGVVCVKQLGQVEKLADCKGAVDFKKPVWVTLDLCGCYGDVFNNDTCRYTPYEIAAQGSDAQKVYRTALRSGSKTVRRTELMVVGQEGVGKTSLIKLLTGQKYDRKETSTKGIPSYVAKIDNPWTSWPICAGYKEISETNSDNDAIRLNIKEISGHDGFFLASQLVPLNAEIILLVFNLMHDLDKRPNESDEKSLYDDLTTLELLDFWMRTVTKSLPSTPSTGKKSPRIILIGSHRNSLGENEIERQSLVEKKFARIKTAVNEAPYRHHVVTRYFAVESSVEDFNNTEITALRQHVWDLLQSEQLIGQEIPLKWLQFDEVRHTSQPILSPAVLRAASGNSFTDMTEAEFKLMLQLNRDRGHIYFQPNNVETALSDVIFMDLNWLIEVLMRFVDISKPTEQSPALLKSWKRLTEEGIMEECLINHVLRDKLSEGQEGTTDSTRDAKQAVVDLLCHLDMMCPQHPQPNQGRENEKPARQGTSERSYFTHLHLSHTRSNKMDTIDPSSSHVFYVDFMHVLPEGIFRRIVVRVLRWTQEKGDEEPRLIHKGISFFFDVDHEVQIKMSSLKMAYIKVCIRKPAVVQTSKRQSSHKIEKESAPSSVITRKVKDFLSDMLNPEKCPWLHGFHFRFCVKCPCNVEGALHFLSIDDCLGKQRIRCPRQPDVRIDPSGFKEMFDGSDSQPFPICDDHVMSEKHLRQVAKKLGPEWEQVAVLLGFKTADLYRFKEDNYGTDGQIFGMLVAWSHQEGGDVRQKAKNLGEALGECGRKDVKEELVDPYV
ncbi:uncharacterized protein [Asterias amurensis]|uniref:uncharacterized protein n=1 Tax=Asterias amurensis TaxID=7602 RepID=UPI003AB4E0A1